MALVIAGGLLPARAVMIDFESASGYSTTGGSFTDGGPQGQPSLAGATKWTGSATNASNDPMRVVADSIDGNGQMLQTTASGANPFYTFTASNADLQGTFDNTSSELGFSFQWALNGTPNASQTVMQRFSLGASSAPYIQFQLLSSGNITFQNGTTTYWASITGNSTTSYVSGTSFTATANTWVKITGLIDFSTGVYTFYINGVQIKTSAGTNFPFSTTVLTNLTSAVNLRQLNGTSNYVQSALDNINLFLPARTALIDFESASGYSTTGGTFADGGPQGQPSTSGATKWTGGATSSSNDPMRVVPDTIDGLGQMLQTTASAANPFHTFTPSTGDLEGTFNNTTSQLNFSFLWALNATPNSSQTVMQRFSFGASSAPYLTFQLLSSGNITFSNGATTYWASVTGNSTTSYSAGVSFVASANTWVKVSGLIDFSTGAYTFYINGTQIKTSAGTSFPFVNTTPANLTPAINLRELNGTSNYVQTSLDDIDLQVGNVIDDFDGRTTPAPWTLIRNLGLSGSLTLNTGYVGTGLHLAYDFSQNGGGGAYVGAHLPLSTSLASSTTAIGFWAKSPPGLILSLRVVDSSGQTLQYLLSRPFEVLMNTTAWYQHVVPLDAPNTWSGGSNNGVVQYPITAIDILAADPIETPGGVGPVGAIDIDEVTSYTSNALALSRALPVTAAPPNSANFQSRLGISSHGGDWTASTLDLAKNAGFKWLRTDLKWAAIETTVTTPATYNWTTYDNLVTLLTARGINALFILDYGNHIYTGQPTDMYPPTTTTAINAYAAYCKAAAIHFAGKGVRFEVWNEPDATYAWQPAPNATQYAPVLTAAITAVHAGDPTAIVTTGGLGNFDDYYLRTYLTAGGGNGTDAVGVHPYGVFINGTNQTGIFTDNVLYFRSVVTQFYSPVPDVWDTEWGFSSQTFNNANGHDTTARNREAMITARALLSACGAGFPMYVNYDLTDDGTDQTNKEDNFGLLDNSHTPKPGYYAVQNLVTLTTGHNFVGFVHTAPSSLVAMRFDDTTPGSTDSVMAVWSVAPNNNVSLQVPSNATAKDYLGNTLTLTPQGSGQVLNFNEATQGPVYITFPN